MKITVFELKKITISGYDGKLKIKEKNCNAMAVLEIHNENRNQESIHQVDTAVLHIYTESTDIRAHEGETYIIMRTWR